MKHLPILFVSLLFSACLLKKETVEKPDIFKKGKKLAELKGKELSELSGLAASVSNPGMLWTHNDSGNEAALFLIDVSLNIKKTYLLQGVENRDWEDIAVGPGPDSTKQYVYIAEIGDNEAIHELKFIYRFEEPVWDAEAGVATIADFDTITFQLPDGRKDTEALFIDPSTRDLYIISKRESPVYLYQIHYPYSVHDTLTATQMAALSLTQIVAADVSADGSEVILKNYNHIYYWNNTAQKTIVELLQEMPQEIPYQIEPQGESIAWARDNSGFYTISEQNRGKKSFLYFYQREK